MNRSTMTDPARPGKSIAAARSAPGGCCLPFMRLIRMIRVVQVNSPAFSGENQGNSPMRMYHFLAAAAAVGALAVPAAAQSSYPYQSYPIEQVPQPYPGQPSY